MIRFFALITFISSVATSSLAGTSPSDVYQIATLLEMQVTGLKDARGVAKSVKIPPVQSDKLPIHVYAKALEVREKINRLQIKAGVPTIGPGAMATKRFTPEDVFESVAQLNQAMDEILVKEGISVLNNAPNVIGKTPSSVYEKLWQVSFLLDTLVGGIKPHQVFNKTLKAREELQLIANALNYSATLSEPEPRSATPNDVTIEGFRNMYRLAKLERALNMKAVRVSNFPAGKITPSEAYDATNNMLAELTRIKVALNIHDTIELQSSAASHTTPDQVLINMRAFGQLTDALLEKMGAKNAGAQ